MASPLQRMIDDVARQCGASSAVIDIDNRSGFADIDQTTTPGRFVGLLDAITAMDFARAYKRRSFELLQVRTGSVILDIGCGTGDDVRELAHLVGPSGQVVGVDRSETVIAEARARAEGTGLPVEYQVGDAHHLDFADNSFGGCRADRVLHHLDYPRQALGELVRVAQPGARVVAFEPDFETALVDAADRSLTRRLLHWYCDSYRQGWMGRHLPGLFREVGLREVGIEPVTVLLTDFAEGNTILALEGTVERAQAEGLVSPAEATAWLNALKDADRQGRFFGAITGFLVSGRKP